MTSPSVCRPGPPAATRVLPGDCWWTTYPRPYPFRPSAGGPGPGGFDSGPARGGRPLDSASWGLRPRGVRPDLPLHSGFPCPVPIWFGRGRVTWASPRVRPPEYAAGLAVWPSAASSRPRCRVGGEGGTGGGTHLGVRYLPGRWYVPVCFAALGPGGAPPGTIAFISHWLPQPTLPGPGAPAPRGIGTSGCGGAFPLSRPLVWLSWAFRGMFPLGPVVRGGGAGLTAAWGGGCFGGAGLPAGAGGGAQCI